VVFLEADGRRIEPVRAPQQQVPSVAAASRLGRQLEEVIASLSKVDARFALIGGLALASHKVIRATTQDLEDIKALIAANRQALKMDEVREYFRLFNREALLEEILK
jgi:hypothetical protein